MYFIFLQNVIKKVKMKSLVFICVLTYLIWFITSLYISNQKFFTYYKYVDAKMNFTNDISCYKLLDENIQLKANNLNVTHRTIFFLETSCKGGLNSKQACAVESASRANPDWNIYILVTGPLDPEYEGGKTLEVLSLLSNVKFARIMVKEFTKGTKIENIYKKKIHRSAFPVAHSSDILRMLILNKYGGIYLDLDVIVVRSLKMLPKNFLGKEIENYLGSSIVGMSRHGIGKKFTNLGLDYLSRWFLPKYWSDSGPLLMTRIMNKICRTSNISQWSPNICEGIEILDSKYLFPIRYPGWKAYYSDGDIESYPEAYTHHLWTAMGEYNLTNNSLLAKLAHKYCPHVYNKYGSKLGNEKPFRVRDPVHMKEPPEIIRILKTKKKTNDSIFA